MKWLLHGWTLAILFVMKTTMGYAQPQGELLCLSYQSDEDRPYSEFVISVLSQSLHQPADSTAPKAVEAILVVRQDGVIKDANRWRLAAPTNDGKDFYYRHRLALAPGSYQVELMLKDAYGDVHSAMQTIKEEHKVHAPRTDVSMSDLTLLSDVQQSSLSSDQLKHGYIMEPMKFGFLHSQRQDLQAFFEVYHTDALRDEAYRVDYSVIYRSPFQPDTIYRSTTPRHAALVDPVIFSVPVEKSWSSGKYSLLVQIRDTFGALYDAREEHFILSNPTFEAEDVTEEDLLARSFVGVLTEEELDYSLKALSARVNPEDVKKLDNLVQQGKVIDKRRFLYGYWKKFYAIEPQVAYEEYMVRVRQIDQLFYDGLGHGFESDRGYIMIKYGAPDHRVSVEDEPTAPPYEIWTYDEFPATRQNNVRFVFYSPFSNNYELLHSTARGEINDPQWLIKLYANSQEDVIGNSIDARNVGDHMNRRAAELFNDN